MSKSMLRRKLFTSAFDVAPYIKEKNQRKRLLRALSTTMRLQDRGGELLQRRWTIGDLHALDKTRKAEGYPPMFFSEEDC